MKKKIYASALVLACGTASLAGCSKNGAAADARETAAAPQAAAAADTRVYHNLFTEVCGIDSAEVDRRIDALWQHFFTPGNLDNYLTETSVYYIDSDTTAFIYDTGSRDVRTEGMSYGMMISLQLDKRDVFDRLWRWSKTHMAFKDPSMDGYFCWHCLPDGTQLPGHNATDGEIYYATALLMAANRWNEPRYAEEAQELLRKFYDKDPATGIYPLFDKDTKMPCFVPNEEVHWFSDPSYALPAFLEIWAERSLTNREFWAEAADANRDFLIGASHPVTGLFPDYSTMDYKPYLWPKAGYDTERFQYDAIRCAMNIGMDAHFYGKDIERQRQVVRRLLTFFKNDGYRHGTFKVDGSAPAEDMTESTYGANAVATFSLLGSDDPADRELMEEALTLFWQQPFPEGQWRYYNGMVYFLSLLHASGRFHIY